MEIPKNWEKYLLDETKKTYFAELTAFLADEKKRGATVYPAEENIFYALELTDFENVKAVILGQDPYHEEGQAQGLAFSVPKGKILPPSLKNIFRELTDDIGCPFPPSGDLSAWARQGVLLLNASLTVRAHAANSHSKRGWEVFTDRIISLLAERTTPTAFVLWGSYARQKKSLIPSPPHAIIESPHPSPLSADRGFFGSKPFSKINSFLEANNETPINWNLRAI